MWEVRDSLARVCDSPGRRVTWSSDLKQSIADSDPVILLQNHEHYDVETSLGSVQNVLDTHSVVTHGRVRHRH